MSIEKKRRWPLACLTGAIVFAAALSLRAATIEVENDDEDLGTVPTPSAHAPVAKSAPPSSSKVQAAPKPPPAPPAPPSQISALPPATEAVSTQKRVRISEDVGFYSFLKAGFVADPSRVSPLGKVIGSFDYNANYSFPKRTYVEMSSPGAKVSPGDLLVVYRHMPDVEDNTMGTSGAPIENQAIVKVIESQNQRCLVEVFKSFRPFQEGDLVEPYENEIRRWKQAQAKKPLPSHPVTCFVAGGESGMESYAQTGIVYLSAGAKKGVVEGQTFELREPQTTGSLTDNLRVPRGEAQVIFTGPDFSTAMILTSHEPITKGFEADYEP